MKPTVFIHTNEKQILGALGHEFFVIDKRIHVVDPKSRAIVTIIE